MTRLLRGLLMLALLVVPTAPLHADELVSVGSKTFTESHLLGEIVAQLLEARGFTVERRLSLGGTLIAFEALEAGELDIYPEYTGTLERAVLDTPGMSRKELEARLAARGLSFAVALGFNNNYAIAVPAALALERGLENISDLAAHPDLALGFSHEFLNREDGWPALQALYGLPQRPTGIEHNLAYRALQSGALAVTDAYSTDGELDRYALRLLRDDLGLFPVYDAGLLVRQDLDPTALTALAALEDRIDERRMRALNRAVAVDGLSPFDVAGRFLREEGLVDDVRESESRLARIARHCVDHLRLTLVALVLACIVAIPLSLLVYRSPRVANSLQYVAGLIQTVPALALLALLIPVLGLGQLTAILALFLYSLLPIVRNTLAGLAGVDPLLQEVARSLGMSRSQQLLRVELPLAAPMIVTGVRTAAVISIGTATLAAFVGAGGLGEPILTGLSLSDHGLILEGAIPAALLALITEFAFERLEQHLLPAHLHRR